jgi:type III pantothenate kinase
MNLVIDFGNTRVKAALFNGKNLLETKVYDNEADFIKDLGRFKEARSCIIGSVTAAHETVIKALGDQIKIHHFTAQTALPIKNLYQSASTLGSDRIAAAVGAYSIYPNKNVLSIDAGTCMKFNFTNNKNEYLGGAISSGLQIRFKALHDYTHRLPKVKLEEHFNKLIGGTTNESILSGVINGIIAETDGFIDAYKKQYPDLVVAFTGGDTDFFAKRLKNSIFTHPNLVLTGLNEILIYNS